MHDALDDLTINYVLAARPHFENLRHVAAQLAGLLVLAAAGARSAAPDHPMLHSAEALFQESKDGIRRARTTDRALPHHRHLTQAAASIETALSVARDRLGRPNGHVDLDFNKAKNPPCAFTDFATCPLPPAANRLLLAVTAGELDSGHR